MAKASHPARRRRTVANGALRQAFAAYTDASLRGVCHQIAEDEALLSLAAGARPGSYMPYFFLSCVRYLFLGDPRHPLAAVLLSAASAEPLSDAQYEVFRAYCLAHAPALKQLVASARTQTNDVLRSAVLAPAFCLAAARTGAAPLGLVEVGASAGLNLCWDKYRYNYGVVGSFGAEEAEVRLRLDWRGAAPGAWLRRIPEVSARIGIDLDPIDLEDDDEVRWLRSFVPDATGVLEAAIAVARATERRLIRGDALEKLEAVVEGLHPGSAACVFHSFCTYQFSDVGLRRFESLITRLGQRRPLHWISLEGQSLRLVSFLPGEPAVPQLLATTDVAGGVHRWFSWSYAGRT